MLAKPKSKAFIIGHRSTRGYGGNQPKNADTIKRRMITQDRLVFFRGWDIVPIPYLRFMSQTKHHLRQKAKGRKIIWHGRFNK
jgi:hypothetical protein